MIQLNVVWSRFWLNDRIKGAREQDESHLEGRKRGGKKGGRGEKRDCCWGWVSVLRGFTTWTRNTRNETDCNHHPSFWWVGYILNVLYFHMLHDWLFTHKASTDTLFYLCLLKYTFTKILYIFPVCCMIVVSCALILLMVALFLHPWCIGRQENFLSFHTEKNSLLQILQAWVNFKTSNKKSKCATYDKNVFSMQFNTVLGLFKYFDVLFEGSDLPLFSLFQTMKQTQQGHRGFSFLKSLNK